MTQSDPTRHVSSNCENGDHEFCAAMVENDNSLDPCKCACGHPSDPMTQNDPTREALLALMNEPTMDFRTGAARALFDKAKRSATNEITITAQSLRVLLPQIEHEAKGDAIRAALAALPTTPTLDARLRLAERTIDLLTKQRDEAEAALAALPTTPTPSLDPCETSDEMPGWCAAHSAWFHPRLAALSQSNPEPPRKCGSCGTPDHYAGDKKHPCIPPNRETTCGCT